MRPDTQESTSIVAFLYTDSVCVCVCVCMCVCLCVWYVGGIVVLLLILK